jgi:hypothetical protein
MWHGAAYRYPAEIIAQCVRLYYRFPLSHRGIEELMFERGIIVSYESIRRWCHKFGPAIERSIASIKDSTIGRRTPTSRPDNGNERCDGSSLQCRRSGFWNDSAPSENTSVLADIASRAGTTAPSFSRVSRPGAT